MVLEKFPFKKRQSYALILSFFLIVPILVLPLIVLAHGDDIEEFHEGLPENMQEGIHKNALTVILIAGSIAAIFVLISIFHKKQSKKLKVFLFLAIVIPILLATLYSAASTVYLNIISETKGPVHWHADFEVWACDEMLDLTDPQGISNRVGSPMFHEHNDNRIHVEGVVKDVEDVGLGRFFEFIGGELHRDHFMLPTNKGAVEKSNGDLCPDGYGKMQAFVFKTDEKTKTYTQEKIDDFEEYMLSPYSMIPPGDCIIIEFAPEKSRTGHICTTYRLAIERGELSGS